MNREDLKLAVFCFMVVIMMARAPMPPPFCQPISPNEQVPASQLPQIPPEFSTRLQVSFNNSLKSVEAYISFFPSDYDSELIIMDGQSRMKQVYRYNLNQFIDIDINNNICTINPLNTSSSNFFFGLVVRPSDGAFMPKPSDQVLFFDKTVPQKNMGQTTVRGIPVTQYRSCQNAPNGDSYQVDYFFRDASFPVGVQFDPNYSRLPVSAIVEGYTNVDPATGSSMPFYHEYNFFEFLDTGIQSDDYTRIAPGLYCSGQTDKAPLPTVPDTMSFTEEIIYGGDKGGATTTRIHYNYKKKLFRADVSLIPGFPMINDPLKVVHDFNSGVGYVIDQVLGNCSMYTLGENKLETDYASLSNSPASAIVLKSPEEFLRFDDTYFYVGQTEERGIYCNIWQSNRTDIDLSLMPNPPRYVIVELYIQHMTVVDEGFEQNERFGIVALKAFDPNGKLLFNVQVFEFDSADQSPRVYDVSTCYESKKKREYGLRFRLPRDVTGDQIQELYKHKIEKAFYLPLNSALSQFNYSPVRIMAPRIEIRRDRLTIFSGILDPAPAMLQFKQLEDTKLNTQIPTLITMPAGSPSECASYCVETSTFNSPQFTCLSFDFCSSGIQGGGICSFYNASHVTDPSVQTSTSPTCSHFSKVVDSIDAVTSELAYNSIKNAVERNDFKIPVIDDNGKAVFTLEAYDIYPGNAEADIKPITNETLQQSGFFEQFELFNDEIDLNISEIQKNPALFVRKRNDVSAEECARLCLREPTFSCQSLTFESALAECKWSSLTLETIGQISQSPYVSKAEGFSCFFRNPLYNYYEFPSKVTALTDYKVVEVRSASECARVCDTETSIQCLSFNLCKITGQTDTFNCLISDKNVHSTDRNSSIVYSSLCTHYSKKVVNEYKMYPQTQLGVDPQTRLVDTSVEICSFVCSYEDSFVCRSFDFLNETRTCLLYQENLADKATIDLKVKTNPDSTHYSRQYMLENGEIINIKPKKATIKYGGGTIFGVVFTLIIVGVLIGALSTFSYNKFVKKTNMLPVMKFVNPNYKE